MDVHRTDEFANWLKRLRDVNARARINLRADRIEMTGNLGDFEPVGNGISELKP
jgi:putative addiction module killer protein